MIREIEHIEALANASKVKRLMYNPSRYLGGILHRIFVYPFSKKGKLVDTKTFFGTTMKVLLPAGMDLYLLGGKSHDSEIRLAKFIVSTLEEGMEFLDIGAHFGYFSLLASSIVGDKGKVRSIEASKATFQVLSQNIAQKTNIRGFNIAISDQKEQLDFYEYPLLYSEYNSLNADQYQDSSWAKSIEPNVIQIDAFPLDDFIKTESLNPFLIKIDVEGVEDKVVAGMRRLISSGEKRIIAMEYLLGQDKDTAHDKAIQMIMQFGFGLFVIDSKGELQEMNPKDLKKFLLTSQLDSDNIILR
ncbi:MAG: FkbM family methyltransferase, partial [Saprospiraceae bacterium]|nr:FkbM family methyltransferase [Saprospiraceae bacterium]